MHPEVAQVIMERQLRRQHLPMPWTKYDQEDQNQWEIHDNEKHPHRYGLCPECQRV